ncbi:hypothetical protein AJ80_07499 [Polytolypa hystricis UAMH7299]|uniref:Chitin synthase activator n=1 Tax=Polytolypa hystricis (strain UAMH7299) TaxID=1447883 RepID=A0A2B7XP25_POLH7|nr:hypothetical protein AJ80_07499 [Polytolypa hystricis UAMH7299]
MAYPQRPPPQRHYTDRPPPQGDRWQGQMQGGGFYDQGGHDNYGAYDYNAEAGYDDGYGAQGQWDNQQGLNGYPNQGRGGPQSYGHNDQGYSNHQPGRNPSRNDRGRMRPPPLQPRHPRQANERPPISPRHAGRAGFDNPFPTFPSRKQGDSGAVINSRMEALDLNGSSGRVRPPDARPHTSHSNRPHQPRQHTEPQPRMPPPRDPGYGTGPNPMLGNGPRNIPPGPGPDPAPGMPPPKRSATMPVQQAAPVTSPVTSPYYPGKPVWQEPPPSPRNFGPDSHAAVPPRPGTAPGTRPLPIEVPSVPSVSESKGSDNTKPSQPPPTEQKDAADDFLDDYFNSTDSAEPDMPNFDAVPDSAGDKSNEDHLVPVDTSKETPATKPDTGGAGYTAYRPPGGVVQPTDRTGTPSQRNNNAGFQFDVPPQSATPAIYDQQQPNDGYGPPMDANYPPSQGGRGMYGGGQYGPDPGPGGYGPRRPPPNQYPPPVQRNDTPQLYPDSQQYQSPHATPSPVDRSMSVSRNPDALPHHPVPFRPGLEQQSKPSPVRQYDNPPPVPTPQGQGQVAPPTTERPGSEIITFTELQRLQQTAKMNPHDLKTQLLLAKKLVEASVHLIDDNGRADTKTKNKNRERFINDAHKIVKKMVSNGYPPAMFYLADSYGQGRLGLENDPREAFNLYQSAAKAGHPESAYRVAVCCEMGQEGGGGTRRDPMKAVQWYRRAAAMGDTPAMYKMGIILLKGLLGQPRNPREAVSWLKRAAERADEDNPHALHELALLYENPNGIDAIIQDEAYSLELLHQAGELGYKFSQYRLGMAYENGLLGCPVDPRQSIIWYTRAAAQGEHQSELALSGWYLTGSEAILQQSDTEAYLWARKAAIAGLAKAEYAMGYFTEVGIGVPANLEDAKRWYWKASSQNYGKARDRLEDLRRGGAKMQKTRVSRSAVNRQSEGDCVVM